MDFMLHQNIAFLSHTKIAYLSLSFPRCSHHRNIPWFVPLAPASIYHFGFQSSQLVCFFTVVSYSHCMWDVFSFLSYCPDPTVSPTVGPHPALLHPSPGRWYRVCAATGRGMKLLARLSSVRFQRAEAMVSAPVSPILVSALTNTW